MTSSPLPENEETVRSRLKSGDPSALEEVLERHWDSVVAYAGRIMDSEEMGEEIAQLTFVKLWQTRQRLSGPGSIKALLFRIARNSAYDELKRGGKNAQFVELQDSDLQTVATPADEVEAIELEEQFINTLRRMPKARREVFLLLRFGDFSYKEAASFLNLSPQTIANHMSLALKDLKTSLASHLEFE